MYLDKIFHYKPSILGYPHFRKRQFLGFCAPSRACARAVQGRLRVRSAQWKVCKSGHILRESQMKGIGTW